MEQSNELSSSQVKGMEQSNELSSSQVKGMEQSNELSSSQVKGMEQSNELSSSWGLSSSSFGLFHKIKQSSKQTFEIRNI